MLDIVFSFSILSLSPTDPFIFSPIFAFFHLFIHTSNQAYNKMGNRPQTEMRAWIGEGILLKATEFLLDTLSISHSSAFSWITKWKQKKNKTAFIKIYTLFIIIIILRYKFFFHCFFSSLLIAFLPLMSFPSTPAREKKRISILFLYIP